ncbi:hypothetical protein [Anaerofustis sp.]|uniref:hypothetical protein n=1 Tax=Anaerofustis sp. TaxID=1872517 RepID=UPI0025BB14C2|nr:hypothetical protein [Anaerofustis sp.]
MKKRRKSDFAAGAFSALTGGIGAGGSLIKKSIQPKNGSMKSVGRGKESSYHRVNNHIKSINPYGYKKNTEGYLGYSENLQRKYKNPVNAGYSKDYGIKSGYEKKYTEPYEAYYGKGKEEDNASEYLKTLNPYGIKTGNKNGKRGVLSGDFKGRESIHGIKGNSGGSASYNNGIGAGFSKKEPNRQKGVFARGKDTNITNPLYLKEKENGRGVLSLNPYGYKAESKKAGGNGTAGERSPYRDYSQKSSSFGYPKSFGVNRYFDILDKGTGKRTHKIESAKNEDRAYRYGVYGGNGFRVTPYTKREKKNYLTGNGKSWDGKMNDYVDLLVDRETILKTFVDELRRSKYSRAHSKGRVYNVNTDDVVNYMGMYDNRDYLNKNITDAKPAEIKNPNEFGSRTYDYLSEDEIKGIVNKAETEYSDKVIDEKIKAYGAEGMDFKNNFAVSTNPYLRGTLFKGLKSLNEKELQRVYLISREKGINAANEYISLLNDRVALREKVKTDEVLKDAGPIPLYIFSMLNRNQNNRENLVKGIDMVFSKNHNPSPVTAMDLTLKDIEESGSRLQKKSVKMAKERADLLYALKLSLLKGGNELGAFTAVGDELNERDHEYRYYKEHDKLKDFSDDKKSTGKEFEKNYMDYAYDLALKRGLVSELTGLGLSGAWKGMNNVEGIRDLYNNLFIREALNFNLGKGIDKKWIKNKYREEYEKNNY